MYKTKAWFFMSIDIRVYSIAYHLGSCPCRPTLTLNLSLHNYQRRYFLRNNVTQFVLNKVPIIRVRFQRSSKCSRAKTYGSKIPGG